MNTHPEVPAAQPQSSLKNPAFIRRLIVGVGLLILLLPAPVIVQYTRTEPHPLHRLLVPAGYLGMLVLWPIAIRSMLPFAARLAKRRGFSWVHLAAGVVAGAALLLIFQEKALFSSSTVQAAVMGFSCWVGGIPLLLPWGQAERRVSRSWWKLPVIGTLLLAGFLTIGRMEALSRETSFAVEAGLVILLTAVSCGIATSGLNRQGRRAVFIRWAAGILVVLVCLVFVEVFFRNLPHLIPRSVLVELPQRGEHLQDGIFFYEEAPIQVGRRFQPSIDAWIQGKAQDILIWNGRERFHTLPTASLPSMNVHFVTDQNGFRNPPEAPGEVDVVVGGDSFTVGMEVQTPWTEQLSAISGLSTLNLSVPGLGPQAEAAAVQIYGLDKDPQIVILAYFEGNDLRDAALYARASDAGLSLPQLYLSDVSWDRTLISLTWLRTGAAASARAFGLAGGESSDRDIVPVYPVEVTINGQLLRLSFLDGYISMLAVPRAEIERSLNFQYAAEALLEAQRTSREAGARFLLVYIPTKAHVYAPSISGDQLNQVTSTVLRMTLQDGLLVLDADSAGISAGEFLANMDGQRLALQDFAQMNGIEFIDLTPRFQAAAAEGRELFLPLSIHWNEAGHQLAAEIVAEYIGNQPTQP